MNKEPTIQVPVHVFLDLVHAYKELPQELCDKSVYLIADRLEKRACQRYLEYRKFLRAPKLEPTDASPTHATGVRSPDDKVIFYWLEALEDWIPCN